MGQPPGTATDEPPRPALRPVEGGPATVLLAAVGIGLAAGFLDLGLLVLKKHLSGDFYRLGDGFPWLIPAGVAALVAIPGAVLAMAARLRRGRGGVSLGTTVGLLAFVGLLDVTGRLPVALWSASLLSAGLAVQAARWARAYPRGFLRLARLTAPVLAGAVLALAVATTGVRAWSECRAAAALPPPPPAARNVLLIVWDTVRAQDLSLYGYTRPTTPHLDRLAARGVRFGHAFATSPWTLPSHASLFTGRWPHELSAGWKAPLDDAEPTLAGRLSSLGYDTAGFVANLDFCSREAGLARGFTHYEDYPLSVWEVLTRYVGLSRWADPLSLAVAAEALPGGRPRAARPRLPTSREHARSAADVERAFLGWLSHQRTRGRPFFAFLNYNDAHTPYEVPDDSPRGFGLRPSSTRDRVVLNQWNVLDKMKVPTRLVLMAHDLYDDAIAHLDRRLGSLLAELGRRGVLENTLVIVTSDHGEHLGDHLLFFHGCSLYRQVVEVPLVIVGPKSAPTPMPTGRVVDEPVSLRDLPATVLDLLGQPHAAAFPGRSLARFWNPADGASPPAFEPLLMETDRPTYLTNQGREPAAKGPMKGLIAGGMHYIRSGDGSEELYALSLDPDERTNVAHFRDAQEALEGFRGALRSILRTRDRRETPRSSVGWVRPGGIEP